MDRQLENSYGNWFLIYYNRNSVSPNEKSVITYNGEMAGENDGTRWDGQIYFD